MAGRIVPSQPGIRTADRTLQGEQQEVI
jgi:hypothetical protein